MGATLMKQAKLLIVSGEIGVEAGNKRQHSCMVGSQADLPPAPALHNNVKQTLVQPDEEIFLSELLYWPILVWPAVAEWRQ